MRPSRVSQPSSCNPCSPGSGRSTQALGDAGPSPRKLSVECTVSPSRCCRQQAGSRHTLPCLLFKQQHRSLRLGRCCPLPSFLTVRRVAMSPAVIQLFTTLLPSLPPFLAHFGGVLFSSCPSVPFAIQRSNSETTWTLSQQ